MVLTNSGLIFYSVIFTLNQLYIICMISVFIIIKFLYNPVNKFVLHFLSDYYTLKGTPYNYL